MDIHSLLAEPVDIDAVASFLDDLHHEGRVTAIRAMSGKEQARLFDAMERFPAAVAAVVQLLLGDGYR